MMIGHFILIFYFFGGFFVGLGIVLSPEINHQDRLTVPSRVA